MAFELAQVNIARLRAPLDSEQLADFVASLDPVNASADAADGFVWRLQGDDGNATSIAAFEWDQGDSHGVIVNMSVWRGVDEQAWMATRSPCASRRSEWFHRVSEATVARGGRRGAPPDDRRGGGVAQPRAHGPTEGARPPHRRRPGGKAFAGPVSGHDCRRGSFVPAVHLPAIEPAGDGFQRTDPARRDGLVRWSCWSLPGRPLACAPCSCRPTA